MSTYTYEVTVKKGSIRIIHPSMGYLGIATGQVKVLDITTVAEMDDDTVGICINTIAPNYLDGDVADTVIWNEYEQEPWIQYQYKKPELDKSEGICWLPISMFVEHTTTY